MGMIELGNYCAFFNHFVAVQTPFISGITFGFLSSGYSASYLGVDVIVGGKVAVLNSANLAFRFGMTCGFAADVGRAHSAGMNDHISKPIDVDQLIGAIQLWTNNKRKQK